MEAQQAAGYLPAEIKEAFQSGYLLKGHHWIEMLEDRKKTTHLYDKKEALMVYHKIKETYFRLFSRFQNKNFKKYPENGLNFLLQTRA